jgi:hypothetical protein
MFWWIALVVAVVLGAYAWWSSGHRPMRNSVDDAEVRRARTRNLTKGDYWG